MGTGVFDGKGRGVPVGAGVEEGPPMRVGQTPGVDTVPGIVAPVLNVFGIPVIMPNRKSCLYVTLTLTASGFDDNIVCTETMFAGRTSELRSVTTTVGMFRKPLQACWLDGRTAQRAPTPAECTAESCSLKILATSATPIRRSTRNVAIRASSTVACPFSFFCCAECEWNINAMHGYSSTLKWEYMPDSYLGSTTPENHNRVSFCRRRGYV